MTDYDFNKIHCENAYFAMGVIALIKELLQDYFCDPVEYWLPDVWVFSHDSVDELFPFIRQVVPHRVVIIFGNDFHKRVLRNVPGLEQMVFLNLKESPLKAKDMIKKVFNSCRHGVPVNPVSFIRYPVLTILEKSVLTGFMSGVSLSELASRTGRSVSSISSCKRRIMKKLNVFNNQELFTRAWVMGINSTPDNSPDK